jgi:two-component system, OmpR family, KDP operon response regulator KdpE
VRAVETSLKARSYQVATAPNGETALEILADGGVDLVLLDLGLPGISGNEVLMRLRTWSEVPVIVLSVQQEQDDKVHALDAGADDYLVKPFDVVELLARMRAVLRRAGDETSSPVLTFGELEIDLGRELVRLNGEPVHLTPTEYRLIERMARHPGKLLTHRWLLQEVWGPGYANESHYLRVFVRGLRKKLGDDPAKPRWITTEPGLGYRWLPENS